ncbi:MAG: alpha/beta fold hydrolase [Cyclobacteriaceae bacterium]
MRSTLIIVSLFASSCLLGQHKEELMSINGTKLFVKTIGKGEPIIVVHGGPGMNHTYFMPHLHQLAKDYQVILYDQRASGQSATPSPDSVTLSYFADDIEGIRKATGQNKITLLAHSWGAIPAIEYAKRYPEQTRAIIFCNAVPLNKEFDSEMKENQLRKTSGLDSTDRSIIMGSPNFKAGRASAYRKLLLLSFRNSFVKESNFHKLNFDLPANYVTSSGALYTGLGKELSSYDYYPELKQMTFPVLVMYGEEDAIPAKSQEMITENAPNSQIEVFKKSGHFIFIEEKKKFSAEVDKFIRSIP